MPSQKRGRFVLMCWRVVVRWNRAGNTFLNSPGQEMDRSSEIPRKRSSSSHSSSSSTAITVLNFSSPNPTNRIPLERFNRVEHEYHGGIVQNFMYGANRAKENNAYKFQSTITQSNYNEITSHKFQTTLQWLLYQIPMLIAIISGFEIQPLEAHSVDSVRFWSRFVQTDQA